MITIMYVKEEWHVRRIVMDAALAILSDGKSYTARELLTQLNAHGITVPKQLVNSVLFSEAKRYVTYDKQTYKYSLRHAEAAAAEQAQVSIDLNKLSQPIEQQTTDLYSASTESGSRQSGEAIKARYIGRNDEYKFTTATSTGPTFFDVAAKSRTVEIALNQNHPLFVRLRSLFELPTQADSAATRQHLQQAKQTFELLLAAWAKYEHELPDGQRKFRAEEARSECGRNVRLLLMDELADA